MRSSDPFDDIPSQSARLPPEIKAIIHPELELPVLCPGFIWVPGGPSRRREAEGQLILEV